MAKNLKGGYKIVSLNGLDLVGESLAIAGLYDKLANSYNKPILVSGIVINGEKKKNAFVQVEVLDDGIKINDLYGYDLLVEEDGDITVTANPHELPNTADASAGQVLKLDAQKKPVWGDEAELPDVAEATAGQILGLDEDKNPEWQNKPASGTKLYKHTIPYLVQTSPYPQTKNLILISTDSTVLTEIGMVSTHFQNYGIVAKIGLGVAVEIQANHLAVVTYNGGTSSYEIQKLSYNASTFSDTVTEL